MLHLNQIQILIHTLLENNPALPKFQGEKNHKTPGTLLPTVFFQSPKVSMCAVNTRHLCPLLFLGASHHGLLGLKEKAFCFSDLFPI